MESSLRQKIGLGRLVLFQVCKKFQFQWYEFQFQLVVNSTLQWTKDRHVHVDVSKNSGTPKSSILIGFSIVNHPFWGYPYFWKPPHVHVRTSILSFQRNPLAGWAFSEPDNWCLDEDCAAIGVPWQKNQRC